MMMPAWHHHFVILKHMKASHYLQVAKFEDIPNVGIKMKEDFLLLGFTHPSELRGADAYTLYLSLEKITKKHHDPCVLDTFLAVCDFMRGAKPKPWHHYTKQRKQDFPHI